jgi:hypothetical protein
VSGSNVAIVIFRDTMYSLWLLWVNALITIVHIVFGRPSLATSTSRSANQLRPFTFVLIVVADVELK